jgi:transcriptional regulator with XRE-family HTH domain
MNKGELFPLMVVIGERIRELREGSQKRQGDIAAAARHCGLRWTQATVAAIEIGRRRLSVEEFLFLPFILKEAGVHGRQDGEIRLFELADLFPQDGIILLAPDSRVSTRGIRDVLQGKFGNGWLGDYDTPSLRRMRKKYSITQEDIERMKGELGKIFEILPEANHNRRLLEEMESEMGGDAEQKAAHKLKAPARAVAFAARKLWGRSLTEERDCLVSKQVTTDTPPRTVQAIRGHITRTLLKQIRPLVGGIRKPASRER